MAIPKEDFPHVSEKGDTVSDSRGVIEQEGSALATSATTEKYISSPPKNIEVGNEEKPVSSAESTSDTLADVPECAMDNSTPITYHYLTFQTLLPSPSPRHHSLPATTARPPQPDLKKFQSPFEWSNTRKSLTIWMSCIATLVTAYTAGSYSSGSTQMEAEWGVSPVAINVGITSFCCGFAIAPMVLAPFSEINGRYPVFVLSGILYVVCQLCCAVTRSYPGMIVARFFVGCGSSVFSSMVGGVVSDLYHTKERNTPMAIFSGGALFGTGFGPLISGFIAQHTTWRWIFWLQVITNGILILAFTLFFKETRGNVVLSKKARALNEWYTKCEDMGYFGFDVASNDQGPATSQRIRWKVKSDEERQSLGHMIQISVYRPFHMLCTEPVVFFFSLWVSFAWTVLYATFTSIPLVFRRSHGFNTEQSGSVFAVLSIAAILATILSIWQEKFLNKAIARLGYTKSTDALGRTATQTSRFTLRKLDLTSPEARLYFACAESALLPVGLFMFGWTQFSYIHWIVPTIALGLSTMGIFSIYLATFNYLADTYHRYASSALAAQSFCRNILGGIFPLFTAAMFNNLTFQGAASLLGGLGALLTLVPWILVYAGPTIRARSKFASEIM